MSHKGEGDLKEGSGKISHRMGYQEKYVGCCAERVIESDDTIFPPPKVL